MADHPVGRSCPAYTFDGGGIVPITLGTVFNPDAHAIAVPDRGTLSTAGGSARWYRDAKAWASAVNEVLATEAWHAASVTIIGGEQWNLTPHATDRPPWPWRQWQSVPRPVL